MRTIKYVFIIITTITSLYLQAGQLTDDYLKDHQRLVEHAKTTTLSLTRDQALFIAVQNTAHNQLSGHREIINQWTEKLNTLFTLNRLQQLFCPHCQILTRHIFPLMTQSAPRLENPRKQTFKHAVILLCNHLTNDQNLLAVASHDGKLIWRISDYPRLITEAKETIDNMNSDLKSQLRPTSNSQRLSQMKVLFTLFYFVSDTINKIKAGLISKLQLWSPPFEHKGLPMQLYTNLLDGCCYLVLGSPETDHPLEYGLIHSRTPENEKAYSRRIKAAVVDKTTGRSHIKNQPPITLDEKRTGFAKKQKILQLETSQAAESDSNSLYIQVEVTFQEEGEAASPPLQQ